MIKAKTKVKMNTAALARKARWAMMPPLQKAASQITRSAKGLIKKSEKKYSSPGESPRTRGKGRSLKRAIRYHVDHQAGVAVIGPAANVTSLTGHFHEFGGVQMVKGRRRKYAIDRYGPMRRKAGYVTPRRKLKDSTLPIAGGIAFGKIKSPTQRLRAQLLDRRFFPDVENPKPRRYPKRPFMWPAVEKNRQSLIKLFADSIK